MDRLKANPPSAGRSSAGLGGNIPAPLPALAWPEINAKPGSILPRRRSTSCPRSLTALPADLFQIGSIKKSFTSVAILHLATAAKLTIEDDLSKWLPQYPTWKDVTIHQLLDMTSPIPGYDNQASIAKIMGDDPKHGFTPQELVASVYPHNGKPKPVSGWTYSNTNYILAQMIIEKAGGKPYADVLRGLFDQVGLKNTYYEENLYPASITDRMVSGY